MLKEIDLSVRLEAAEYKKIMPDLELRIGELQRLARDFNIPILIIFEGLEASGKGTLINKLIMPLDPRGFKVYSTLPPNNDEKLRPFLWRFWIKTPAKGRIVIFDRSWYQRLLIDLAGKIIKKYDTAASIYDIKAFERQLIESGYLLIKFWLHISREEQASRLLKLEEKKSTAWRVTKEDWAVNRKYEKYQTAIEEIIEKTGTSQSPWNIIEADDERYATVKIFNKTIEIIEKRIKNKVENELGMDNHNKVAVQRAEIISSFLDKVDLSRNATKDDYEKRIGKYQKKFREIEYEIYTKRIPVIIVFEGWDAAGKGGCIKRLTRNLDPRGYEVIPVGPPGDTDKTHHYLWRFWNTIPKGGHIGIYDRSWYGRVLVERVENLCSARDWKRAYKEINEFEEHLSNSGYVIIKFWLHIDKDEQLKRFQSRENDPYKKWKITDEDYRNRKSWDLYYQAVDEMIYRTDTIHAPWVIVESNSKYYSRLKVMKTVIETVQNRIKLGS